MIGLAEIRAEGWKYGCLAALAGLLLALVGGGAQTVRVAHLQTELAQAKTDAAQAAAYAAEQATKASEAVRKEEQTRARYIAGIDAAYQRGLNDAKAAGDRVAADLRAGVQRFRSLWAECSAKPSGGVSGAAPGAGGADAAADDRAASAGRIVRAAAACDAQVKGLQDVVRADRGEHASRPRN